VRNASARSNTVRNASARSNAVQNASDPIACTTAAQTAKSDDVALASVGGSPCAPLAHAPRQRASVAPIHKGALSWRLRAARDGREPPTFGSPKHMGARTAARADAVLNASAPINRMSAVPSASDRYLARTPCKTRALPSPGMSTGPMPSLRACDLTEVNASLNHVGMSSDARTVVRDSRGFFSREHVDFS
jgi:hypothetical protein